MFGNEQQCIKMQRAEDLEGFKEYIQILEKLVDEKTLQGILRQANREVLKPLQSKLRAVPYNAKPKWGIRATTVDGQKHPNAVILGPVAEARKSKYEPPQAILLRWLDKGTKDRYTKQGWYRGMITGTHLVEPIIDAEAEKIENNITLSYAEGMIKAVNKYSKKITKK